jgi:PHP family Zn ribbon phosphoesterase
MVVADENANLQTAVDKMIELEAIRDHLMEFKEKEAEQLQADLAAKDKEIARLKTSLVKALRHARERRLKCSPGCACDMCLDVIEILEGSGE